MFTARVSEQQALLERREKARKKLLEMKVKAKRDNLGLYMPYYNPYYKRNYHSYYSRNQYPLPHKIYHSFPDYDQIIPLGNTDSPDLESSPYMIQQIVPMAQLYNYREGVLGGYIKMM